MKTGGGAEEEEEEEAGKGKDKCRRERLGKKGQRRYCRQEVTTDIGEIGEI
jgi:hypothetical protein